MFIHILFYMGVVICKKLLLFSSLLFPLLLPLLLFSFIYLSQILSAVLSKNLLCQLRPLKPL